MATSSPPSGGSDPGDAWTKLTALNKLALRQLRVPQTPSPAAQPGAPSAAPALSAEIDNARQQFTVFTSQATALEAAINRGESVTDEQIGGALDKARAWVEYLGTQGPLCRGFPAGTPPQVYVDAMARVGQLLRLAQQWTDYFAPLWQRRSGGGQSRAADEQAAAQRVTDAERDLQQRKVSFALNSSSMSAQQMQGQLAEVNNLLATVQGWSAAAGSQAAQRIAGLIQAINSVRDNFQFACNSKRAFEEFQRRQGMLPGPGQVLSARPGPGSPEWFSAVTGMNCYWCRYSISALPQPVPICPNCHRYPQPPGY